MRHEIPVFDGDGHVLETDTQLSQHYEGKWKGNRRLDGMTIFPSLDGWSRSTIIEEADEGRKHWSTDAKIWAEILDQVGLEGSVLYPTAGLAYGLMQSEEFQTATCVAYNNWIEAEYTKKDGRLFGVGLTPYNDVPTAVKEVARCKNERKNIVAMLLPSVTVNGKHFGDESYWPIYEEAERENMPLVFHGAPSRDFGLNNLKPFLKVHTLEHPVPLMIQLTAMMFSGVFETFPKLKFAFLEGGWFRWFTAPPRGNEAHGSAASIATNSVAPWARGYGPSQPLTRAVEDVARPPEFAVLGLDVGADQPAPIQPCESLGFVCWGTNPTNLTYAIAYGRAVARRYHSKQLGPLPVLPDGAGGTGTP